MRTDQTVFIIDDDASARDSLGTLLSAVGQEFQAFDSAEAFLASARRSSPGCVVTDVKLPGMSGVELADMLHRTGVKLPVIVITGWTDGSVELECSGQHVVAVLQKPCLGKDMLAAIRKGLGGLKSLDSTS